MEFKEFNLHPDLQRGLTDAGYLTCMPVQEQVLINAFGGHDLYVQSQTGTGKTAAFLVVIFQRLLTEPLLNGKKAIIMVPTRELAVQVEEEAKLLGKYLPFMVGSFYGGVGYTQQQKALRDNVQILMGTPGRVLDLNSSGQMNLMDIAFMVLDEADRMFDMGFYPDLRKLIKVVPPVDRRQTMLFSATLNAWVKNLAWEYTKSPLEIEIAPETVTVDEVEQVLYHVPSNDKMRLLLGIMEREKPESAIVFCNTKRYTEIVAKRLRINGIECEFIIGDLPQVKRLKIIDDIKAGAAHFLVATDVAARGLDIEGLALVVNYDLPVEAENYVHRIGRTARAGKTGRAITLASEQDVYELPAIERYIGKKIPSEIATEELYGEDKSRGMRIHTDSYDDHYEERDNRRSGGRDDGRRRGGRDRSGEDKPGFGRSREDGRQRGEGRAEGRRGSGSRGNAPPRAAGGESPREDLSKLSFNERMAYYKQKYEGEARPVPGTNSGKPPRDRKFPEDAKDGGRPSRSRRRGPREGQVPGEDRLSSPSSGAARSGGGRRRDSQGQGRRRGGPREARPGQEGRPEGPGRRPENRSLGPGSGGTASREAPQQGILSRIFGIFKKNDDQGKKP
jgi:ATP-dependent RNA helicase RhlB